MRKLLLQNTVILSGFIKQAPKIEPIELKNNTQLNKTSVYFYFYSSEFQSINSIKITAWGKNGEDLSNIPLGEFFSINGILRTYKYNSDSEKQSSDYGVEILVKNIQKNIDVDDEF